MSSVKRRFIAGARCPQCQAMDKLVRVEAGEQVQIECVACGMVRNLNDPPPTEHPVAEASGVVRFVEKPMKKRD